jgi:membrane-associated phospholipid phosphatase
LGQHPAIADNERTSSRVPKYAVGLGAGEKVILGFLAYAVVASAFFPISFRQRLTVFCVNVLSGWVVFLLSRLPPHDRTEFLAIVRDWLPCVLILLAYRESGLFYIPDPTHRLDEVFIRWDRAMLNSVWVGKVLSAGSPWLQRYLEVSYLLCYPLVPFGLGSLYLARRAGALRPPDFERSVSRFWMAVLLALFFCYVVFPLFPLTPPRSLFNDVPGPPVRSWLRRMNFWLLGQYGVEACVFPSGHVAAVTAAALSVGAYLPRVGWLFLIAAISVAVATVYGRYHYAADALAGAVVGVAAFWIAKH